MAGANIRFVQGSVERFHAEIVEAAGGKTSGSLAAVISPVSSTMLVSLMKPLSKWRLLPWAKENSSFHG